MPVLVADQSVKIIRLSVPLDCFPALLAAHPEAQPQGGAPTTDQLEQHAVRYVAGRYQPDETADFVKAVCWWGNYAGVAGKVLRRNTSTTIADALRRGRDHVVAGRPAQAIASVIALEGLGVSFGSKHLRFLAPAHAVVLDSIISERLGYLRTAEGYSEFVADCACLRDILNERQIAATPDRKTWRISDVEMAIYMSLRS
jgi:hypothetical protein